jgi:hypothetical protein
MSREFIGHYINTIASLTKLHIGTPEHVGLSDVYFPQYSPIESSDVYSLAPTRFR